jgi:prolyl-tRNA synthetase
MLNFAENFMAIPVIKGIKTETERFAGARNLCIEALWDGKASGGNLHF